MAQVENTGYDRFRADMKRKQPGHFYIFYGEEAYLRAHWLDRLHKLLVEDFVEAFNYHRLNAETFSAQALVDCVEAMPMMAERSLVQVDDVDLFKLPEEQRNTVAALLCDLPPHVTLVLVYETVAFAPDKRMKKLAAALESAEAVEFKTPTERELVVWVMRHFKSHAKIIGDAECRYLIRRTGGDMTTLASEIEKVASFADGETITAAEIDAVTEPVLEAVVFELSDAIAAGRFDRAPVILSTLLQKQEKPLSILAVLSAQFRRVLTAKTLLRAGKGSRELMSLCGISSYPAQKTLEFARRLPDGFVDRAVLLCLETEEQMKTSYDEPERLLELFVLRLAQEARHA